MGSPSLGCKICCSLPLGWKILSLLGLNNLSVMPYLTCICLDIGRLWAPFWYPLGPFDFLSAPFWDPFWHPFRSILATYALATALFVKSGGGTAALPRLLGSLASFIQILTDCFSYLLRCFLIGFRLFSILFFLLYLWVSSFLICLTPTYAPSPAASLRVGGIGRQASTNTVSSTTHLIPKRGSDN